MKNDILTQINNLQKKGYLIHKPKNKFPLLQLRKYLITGILKNFPELKKKLTDINDENKFLNNFNKYVKINKLNNLRLKIYNHINSKIFQNNYYEVAKDILNEVVGNELAMQKKINISIQFPNDPDSLLPMHSDIYAGESPFEVVVWIPMVDVYSSKSMFITNPKKNKKLNKQFNNSTKETINSLYKKNKKDFKFIKINFGEILIFSPIILHGNTINKTTETRFSFNCRFKSLLSPYDVKIKSHRTIPHFFKPLNIKPMTKIGFTYLANE